MKKIIPFMLGILCLIANSYAQINNLTTDDTDFFPEDIVITNDVAYVSGLGDGTIKAFDLTEANPTATEFAAAEMGYSQAWGLKSDGTVLLSLLNNADFTGGAPGPAKLVEYDIASGSKTGEWDLPANAVGHTVSIVDGKYYVTDFGTPRIFEVDPSAGTVNDSWFTSTDWDPMISGIGGTIYNNNDGGGGGGFYVSQGNKLWYLPISNGTPGTLQEVAVSGLDIIDADGISWVDSQNTLYYATNDTGDPANVGTVYKLVFSDATTATGSVIATGLDDSSGLWYYENDGSEYVFVLESQFGALFGLNSFEPPFNIEVFQLSEGTPSSLTSDDSDFFPEDIVIANNVAYVSGLGDGTVKMFNLNLENPTAEIFAEAEMGYSQAWGVKSDGTVLLSLLNNADFTGGAPGPAKLVEYDIASGSKTGEWDLPANAVGHTVSIVDGKYYVTDFGTPRIFEVDPSAGTVNDSWFTSTDWDSSISGMGGTIYNGTDAFYASQGNKLWYLPISNGTPGTLQEVTVNGLDAVDADGISWDANTNTLYYATNDTGDPANVGTVYKLVFSDATTATGSIIADGLDDTSGLWHYETGASRYVLVLESQFGALFGLNSYEPPFNIEVVQDDLTNEEKAIALQSNIETGDPSALVYVSDEQYIQHNLSIPSGKETIAGFYPGFPTGVTIDIHRSFEIGDYVIMHTTFGGTSVSGGDQVVFDVWRFEDGLAVEHWDNFADVVDDMDGTTQTDGALTPATDLDQTAANQALLEEAAQTLFVDGDWTNLSGYFNLDEYIQHSVGGGPDASFIAPLEGQTGMPFYDAVKFVHTLGNFGLVMSQGPDITGQDPDGTYAYYDLFRIEDGKVIEHWDVIQLIPPQDEWANNNGKWGDDALIPIENVLANTTNITLAPNPFNYMTNFDIELVKGGEFQFQVFDIAGRQVSGQAIQLNEGTNRFTYDGSHLTNGFYSYRLSNHQGFVSGKMIVLK